MKTKKQQYILRILRRQINNFCFLILLFSFQNENNAQNTKLPTLENMPKSTKKCYLLGLEAYKSNDFFLALKYFEAIEAKGFRSQEERFLFVQILEKVGYYEKAVEQCEILEKEKFKNPLLNYFMALNLMRLVRTSQALDYIKFFLKSKEVRSEYPKETKHLQELKKYLESENAKNDTIIASVYNITENINTPATEFAPIILQDGLLFGSQGIDGIQFYNAKYASKADIPTTRKLYFSKGEKMNLSKPKAFPIEIIGYEISSICFDLSQRIAFLSACKYNEKLQKYTCELFISRKNDKVKDSAFWTTPIPIESLNLPDVSNTHVTFGYDLLREKSMLYFASDRPGGRGGFDIWYSYYNPKNQQLGQAIHGGGKINTTRDDYAPFFHVPTNTLYFSTNGRGGFGGFDIFKSTLLNGAFQEVTLLGAEINSHQDDLFFVTDKNVEYGYLVSNRYSENSFINPHCCDDIFYWDKSKKDTVKKRNIEISLKDKNNNSISPVRYHLTEIDSNKNRIPIENKLVEDRIVLENLKQNATYEVDLFSKNFYRKKIDIPKTNDSFKKYEIILDSINYNPIILPLVEFDFDSFSLTPIARQIIDSLVYPVLINNPSLVIELSAHTDSRGTDLYNETLSTKRAQAIRRYLIYSRDIDEKRLKAVGYGEFVPIAPNENEDGTDNPEGRQRNRRCEFRILRDEVDDF